MRRDVFPAEVSLGDDVFKGVRVCVTSHRLLVFSAERGQAPSLIADQLLADPNTVTPDRSTLQGALDVKLKSGVTAWVNRGGGCGCGSVLKVMPAPFPWRVK